MRLKIEIFEVHITLKKKIITYKILILNITKKYTFDCNFVMKLITFPATLARRNG